MIVTDDDLALVNALQIAPRAPWSALGKILGRHPSTLADRWRTLEREGVAWVIGYPKQIGGRRATAFLGLSAAQGRYAELLEWVLHLPHVASVEDAGGEDDLLLTVLAADHRELATEVIAPLRSSRLVAHVRTSLVTPERATGGVWRLDSLNPAQERELTALNPSPTHRRKEDPKGLAELLEILGRDGRADVARLAEELGVHPSTAGRRLRQALDEDAISFRCDMAQYDSGFPVLSQWFARVPPPTTNACTTSCAATAPCGSCSRSRARPTWFSQSGCATRRRCTNSNSSCSRACRA